MNKYPKIEQYRHFIQELKLRYDFKGKDESDNPIYEHTEPYPKVYLKGRVKLHGTNGGITFKKLENFIDVKYQSREKILVLPNDNYGFARTMSSLDLSPLLKSVDFKDEVTFFGEWTGCQKGVAITEVGKKFFIFDVLVDGEFLENYECDFPHLGIYNINNFTHYDITVDLNYPEMIQNKLVEMTLEVENECPVAKSFGFTGIGEGVVFTTRDRKFRFKSKGEKHSVSKVKVLNSIDVEKLETIEQFVEYSCTENRLKQGLEKIEEHNIQNIGTFIKWVISDVITEEHDTLIENSLTANEVEKHLSNKARNWYLESLK